jgi:hypothetical protein
MAGVGRNKITIGVKFILIGMKFTMDFLNANAWDRIVIFSIIEDKLIEISTLDRPIKTYQRSFIKSLISSMMFISAR